MSQSANPVFDRIRQVDQKLWLPGKGEVDLRVRAAMKVIKDYDERLELARHDITGDWVIFIQLDRDTLYPVIGIGPNLPDNAEDLRAKLAKHDTQRHGDKILRQINESNERIRREARERGLEADGQMAEAFEWGMRREGVLSQKVFIPRDL